ncbi:MAG: amino acid permease [Gemmatimonadetes bacterium]|nr:amino acid permease [Gemmatimonadota bacterium]
MNQAPDAWGERLTRRLGLWSAVAVLVGTTIGSGIFRTPARIAGQLPDPAIMLGAWMLGGVIVLCGALTIAELATAYPRSGGIFTYILETIGPMPAFLFGWAELSVLRASALGAISTIFAEYFCRMMGLDTPMVRWVAMAAILLVATLNYVGVNIAAVVQNLTTAAKYAGIFGLALLCFFAGQGNTANFASTGAVVTSSALATAMVSIMWAYDGWADVTKVSGEVRDPEKNLPASMVIGALLLIVIYCSVNAAFLYLVPVQEMVGAPLIAATAAERIPLLGGAGVAVVSVIVMISTFGATNGSLLTGSRVFFAMADRGLFFQTAARVSPKFGSPSVAIWLSATLAIIYVSFSGFAELADRFVLGTWPFYALAVIGVFVRRRREGVPKSGYKTLGYPVTPVLFLLAGLGMIANAFATDLMGTAITFGIVLVGVPVYYVWRGMRKA